MKFSIRPRRTSGRTVAARYPDIIHLSGIRPDFKIRNRSIVYPVSESLGHFDIRNSNSVTGQPDIRYQADYPVTLIYGLLLFLISITLIFYNKDPDHGSIRIRIQYGSGLGSYKTPELGPILMRIRGQYRSGLGSNTDPNEGPIRIRTRVQ